MGNVISKQSALSKFGWGRSPALLSFGLVCSGFALLGCFILSLVMGAADIEGSTVWSALFQFDGSTEHLIIRTVRLPRSIMAIAVGAALAVAGALTQGLMRNPLASPDILGIEVGAAFVMVLTIFGFGQSAAQVPLLAAFAGAAGTAVIVYGLGNWGHSRSTLNLIIAGSALTYLLSALTAGMLLVSQRTLDEIRFWLAGSLAGRDLNLLLSVLPYLSIGLILALLLGRQMTLLTLGEEVAQGLGVRTVWLKAGVITVVIVLAGSAVALAGPIGFVGLVVPNLTRMLIGVDYRWLLPYTAIFGGLLLSAADIVARVVLRPQELPVGIMTALVGAPFFIYLARSRVKS